MNLLDLVPAFKRHVRQYIQEQDTDSNLAAYLADGIEALNWRWDRDYIVTVTQPNTYEVDPDITAKDKRAVILMGSLIYKAGNIDLSSFRDGDFAYDPQKGKWNPFEQDVNELDKLVPEAAKRLGLAVSAPLRGFSNGYNPESYSWLQTIGAMGSIR